MANEWMVPLVALSTMSSPARSKTTTPLMMTMLPVGAAMRAPIAAVAISQLGENAVSDERRAIEVGVSAVEQALAQTLADGDALPPTPTLDTGARTRLAARIDLIVAAHDGQIVGELLTLITSWVEGGKKPVTQQQLDAYPLISRMVPPDAITQLLIDSVSGGDSDSVSSDAPGSSGATGPASTVTTTQALANAKAATGPGK